jgi:glucosamine-6-phosphate deaminase
MMQDYYTIPADNFSKHSKYDFRFVNSHDELCNAFARELVDLVRTKAENNEMTKVILPVGPLDYQPFAELCNKENVSCESLVIFSMDEYVFADDTAVPIDHPLSFHAFYQRTLLNVLDEDKKLPDDQLIIPNPMDLGIIHHRLAQYGEIDVTYGGFGINGHFAFNSPPNGEVNLENFKNTSVRIVEIREGDIIQMAIGGTMGNIEMIPPKGCTLGMKELLSAKLIHLTFMRSWHAGVLRRALFGPITPNFPGSLVQLHPNVRVTITDIAAQSPPVSILQNPGH